MIRSVLWWANSFLRLHGGGKGSAPPAPDYSAAAAQQTQANEAMQTQADYTNRPTMTTPWGQQTWSATPTVDPATGRQVTQWASNISLTPEEQQALNSQQAIQQGTSQAAQTLLGQATSAFQNPFDWSNLPGAPTDIGKSQQDAYQVMSASLQPGRQVQQQQLETQLANKGIPENSDAWNLAHTQLQGQWTQEDKGLLSQAQAQGISDAQAQEALRQSAIGEEAQARGMPLNELNALLTGQQVQEPNMPNVPQQQTAQAGNILGAAEAQGQYGLQASQLNATSGPDWGTIAGGVASAAIVA